MCPNFKRKVDAAEKNSSAKCLPKDTVEKNSSTKCPPKVTVKKNSTTKCPSSGIEPIYAFACLWMLRIVHCAQARISQLV